TPTSTLFPYTTLFRSFGDASIDREVKRDRRKQKHHLHLERHARVTLHRFGAEQHESGDQDDGEARQKPGREVFRDLLHRQILHRSEEHTSELQSPYDL